MILQQKKTYTSCIIIIIISKVINGWHNRREISSKQVIAASNTLSDFIWTSQTQMFVQVAH